MQKKGAEKARCIKRLQINKIRGVINSLCDHKSDGTFDRNKII